MKTPKGNISFRFYIAGGWGLFITELRTYRNKLLYYHGNMIPRFDNDGNLFNTKRACVRYENEYFLKHAEPVIVDTALLYNAFIPCLDWKSPDTMIMTFDSTNWELTLRLDDKKISFCHDTGTDEFSALVDRLEVIIQRPLIL